MLDAGLVTRIYRAAGADRWRVTPEAFRAALQTSVDKAFSAGDGDRSAVERYLKGLHFEDLALACACAAGDDDAWQHFIVTFRPVLYRAADILDAGGAARECADALYGDLFAAPSRGVTRQSLFRYFHGRSSLATWLKAILSQRWVDRLRHQRRHEQLADDEMTSAGTSFELERPRFVAVMSSALATVLAALDPRDRFRLNCYYARQLTLSQVGRLLNEHEATVSRHLARLRKEIRRCVEENLASVHGLGGAEIDECFAAVSDDPGPLDVSQLLGSAEAIARPTREPGAGALPSSSSTVNVVERRTGRKTIAFARSNEGRQP